MITLLWERPTRLSRARNWSPRRLIVRSSLSLRRPGGTWRKSPGGADILSIFTGIRPLVKSGGARNTASLSRGHTIEIDGAGLLTITGGKWTTYRSMAEDAVNQVGFGHRPSKTENLRVHGSSEGETASDEFAVYGTDGGKIRALIAESPALGKRLHRDLPYTGAEVVWAVRYEMAQTLEDVLARRTRALFLNARAAVEAAPEAARIMAGEMGRGEDWAAREVAEFEELSAGYLPE